MDLLKVDARLDREVETRLARDDAADRLFPATFAASGTPAATKDDVLRGPRD